MSDPIQVIVDEVENISITVNPLPVLVVNVGQVGVAGPTTYLGTLGGSGAAAIFVTPELLGGGDVYG